VLALSFFFQKPGLFIDRHFSTKIMVGVLLFFSAFGLATGDILKAFTSVRSLLLIFAMGYIVAPLLGFIAMKTLFPGGGELSAGLGMGVVVVASAPSTLASAVIWTRMGKGNDALALAGTIMMNVIAFITVPPILYVLLGRAGSVDMKNIALSLLFSLLIPIILGQMTRALISGLATRSKPYISVLNQCIILLIILAKAANAAKEANDRGLVFYSILLVIVAVCFVHSITLALSVLGAKLIGINIRDAKAVALTGSQKTLPVGTLIAETSLSGYPIAVLPVMFYHASQLIIDSFIVDLWKLTPEETTCTDASHLQEAVCSSADGPKDTARGPDV